MQGCILLVIVSWFRPKGVDHSNMTSVQTKILFIYLFFKQASVRGLWQEYRTNAGWTCDRTLIWFSAEWLLTQHEAPSRDSHTVNLRWHVAFVHSSAQVRRWKVLETLTARSLFNLTSLRAQGINQSTTSLSVKAPKTNEHLRNHHSRKNRVKITTRHCLFSQGSFWSFGTKQPFPTAPFWRLCSLGLGEEFVWLFQGRSKPDMNHWWGVTAVSLLSDLALHPPHPAQPGQTTFSSLWNGKNVFAHTKRSPRDDTE